MEAAFLAELWFFSLGSITSAHFGRVGGQPKQFDLPTYLVRNRGTVLTRDQLLHHVWDYNYVGDTRTVDVHIRWLREKIEEDPANPKRLQTVRGVGYCFRW